MRVHRNLNKACWSLTVRGERVKHVDAFALCGVRFIVSEKQRQRVLARKVRAVHAWADGTECPVPATVSALVEVRYNPFRAGTFTRGDTGEPVTSAALVIFGTDGKCWAQL